MNRAVVALALALGSAPLAAACSSSPEVDRATQVTLALSSEAEIPKELDAFSIRIVSTRTGELRFAQDYYPESGREFPTTLGIVPLDEDSLASPLQIDVEGRKGGQIFLRRRAVVSYLPGRNLLLPMPLRMACFQFEDCGPNATCAGGRCVPAGVDPKALATYDASQVFGQPGSCFDEQACLSASAEVEVAQDCTFAIPAGAASGQGNVSVRWAVAPERILALDGADAVEGWERLADGRGRLSPGVCDSHFQRRAPDGSLLVADWAKNVYFAPTCATKTASRPYCFSETTQHAGVGAIVP